MPTRATAIDWRFAPRRPVAGIPLDQIRLSCGYWSDRRSPLNYEFGFANRRFVHDRAALSVFCRSNGAALTTDADRSSFFIALVVVDIFVGLADAISGPYIVLFLVDKAGLGPLGLSAILTARALSAIAFSTAFGAWVDKRTTLAPLLLALAGSSVGYALLGFTTNFVVLFVIAAVPIAIGAAAFSQSIALVKREFNRSSPHTVNRAIGVMRASFSLAWAIGPLIGAILVATAGFRGAFLASAASGVIALATLTLVRAKPLSRRCRPRPPSQARERRFSDRAGFRGPRPVSHRHVPGFDRPSDRPHDIAQRRGKRRRNHDELVRCSGNRGHGRAHLATPSARRTRGDCRRLSPLSSYTSSP